MIEKSTTKCSFLFAFVGHFLLPASSVSGKTKDFFEMDLIECMDQEVITPSKFLQKISDSHGTVIVITSQQIRERGYFNLVDLLEALPGIDVHHQSKSTTLKGEL